MPTPEADVNNAHNPFSFLKAILLGTAIGFFVVLAAPYVVPPHRAPTTYSSADLRLSPPQEHGAKGNVKNPGENPDRPAQSKGQGSEGADQAKGSQTPVPDASEAGKEAAPPEPVLVPAVNLKFPETFSSDEMTAALEPLLSFRISDGDAAAIKDVISSVSRGDDAGARAAIRKISDPAAKSFAEWRRLRGSSADFNEVMAFRKAHPLFPEPPQDALFEKALFLSDAPVADVLKFYTNRNPMTGAGKASLGAALMETGEHDRGLRLIKFAWSRYMLDPTVEERFVARFGSLLDRDDQRRRTLLIEARARQADDPGKKLASASEGKGLKGAARLRAKKAGGQAAHRGRHGGKIKPLKRRGRGRRHSGLENGVAKEVFFIGKNHANGVTSLVEPVRLKKKKDETPPPDEDASAGDVEKGKVNASAKPEAGAGKDDKLGKGLQAKAAENAFNLAKERTGGPGTLLARLKSLRRQGADEDVWSLLRSLSTDKADLADPEKWWDFRRGEVRRALNADHPATAYAIANAHGPLDDETRSEAEFLAGWVALRFMKEPQLAESHFQAARLIKGYARDEARAAYWLGRTKLALGARKEADHFFREAASRFYTYYGSLGLQALRKGAPCEFRTPPHPEQEAIAAFVNENAFKAVMIAKQLDLQPLLLNYLLDLTRQLNDPQQITLTLELIERLEPSHVVVRAAKIALLRGFPVDAYAFPALLPKFDPAGSNAKIELPLLNALTRQESDFHTGSVSRVGARGLMQLMPQTAKLIAAAHKVKYEPSRLISDPSYNVTLGSAFLAQLLSGYDGSYVLSLAAYNAGPGRVKQWIGDFGDPRSKAADPIDWVERIPFTETRTYIQRILESTQLYRCRFENNKARIQILEDLHRGRPGKLPDFDVSGSGELEQVQ